MKELIAFIACVSLFAPGIIAGDPPLTTADRIEAAKACSLAYAEIIKDNSELKLKPKITKAIDVDPKWKKRGVRVEMSLSTAEKLTVVFLCDVIDGKMTPETIHLNVPWHRQEDHPSRGDAFDTLTAGLTGLLTATVAQQQDRDDILKQWREHRRAMIAIGQRKELVAGQTKIVVGTIPGSAHVTWSVD
jgi:hypothetical protein